MSSIYSHLLTQPNPTTTNYYSINFDDLKTRIVTAVKESFHSIKDVSYRSGETLCVVFKRIDASITKVILVAVKIAVIPTVLYLLVLVTCPPLAVSEVLYTVVVGPILEELFFRGFFQTAIEYCQKGCNRFIYRQEPSEEDLKAQKIFRVRITALIFAMAHLTNNAPHIALNLFQCTHCFLGGLTYGYLKEKTNSLALPILGHASNNALAVLLKAAKPVNPYLSLSLFFGWVGHKILWYRYATNPN